MKLTILAICVLAAILGVFPTQGTAQAVPCPENLVCITREAALKALENADELKALKAEVKVKDQAFADLRDELNKIRYEFAACSGERTALRTSGVRDAALIQLMLKLVRPKKFGLINF